MTATKGIADGLSERDLTIIFELASAALDMLSPSVFSDLNLSAHDLDRVSDHIEERLEGVDGLKLSVVGKNGNGGLKNGSKEDDGDENDKDDKDGDDGEAGKDKDGDDGENASAEEDDNE